MTGGPEHHGPYAFPGLPYEEGLRLAALRLKHDRLVEAQEDFLENAARRWRRVRRLRGFLAAVAECRAKAELSPDLQDWLRWAHAHCDTLDPLAAPALAKLQAYAAALRSPPDLPPRHPEEALWRDMGLLDEWLDDDEPGLAQASP